MTKFSKETRAEIAEAFARRNAGVFVPAEFVAEVEEQGRNHPAYEWFEWSNDDAAQKWRVHQARLFVKDIRIKFEVTEIRESKPVRIISEDVPAFISPMANRRDGGGYAFQGGDRFDMAEHCRQAAIALRGWLRRYGAAAHHVGIKAATVEKNIRALESVEETDAAA